MPKENMFTKFMRGFTIFHVIGLVLMVLGWKIGKEYEMIGGEVSGVKIGIHLTFTQLVGTVVFFWELIKSFFKKKEK